MGRGRAIAGTVLFLFVAPGAVAGLIPWWIARWAWREGWLFWPGLLLVALGLIGLLLCFADFALKGGGTPAPVAPTERLVTSRLYRHVRNPMYVAVMALILGQAAMARNLDLLAYGILIWLVTHAFVVTYEEPTLRHRFPDDYVAYFAAVPRWIPRLKPWNSSSDA